MTTEYTGFKQGVEHKFLGLDLISHKVLLQNGPHMYLKMLLWSLNAEKT